MGTPADHADSPGRSADAFGELVAFRREFHACLTTRADAMFELADAVLCGDGPVHSLVELSLVGEHRRGHGSLYAALARGRVDVERLRTSLAALPLPRAADGRLVLAVDITCWLRPDAHTSAERILCHTYGRGKDQHVMIPGWPYSFVTALEPGRSSWTAPLDAQRLAPGHDAATVTAGQLRQLVQRLITAGQWRTVTDTRLYGTATARSWNRLHPRLTHRNAWLDQTGDLPLIEGTVIRLEVNHLPSGAIPKPVWLWWSETRPPTNLEPAAVRHGAGVNGVRRCPGDRADAGRTAAPWPARRAGAPRRRRG